ncbi:hypothetical protein C770_GR4pC0774 (plasmid) [Sinorhizobium meliloti GR4]|nr:hypothetical protein C770_GR4pC0774 [Sinorhizobium meliloti GR4]
MTDIITLALSKLDADPMKCARPTAPRASRHWLRCRPLTYSDDFCDFRIDTERRPLTPILIQQTLRLLNPEFRTSLPHKDCMTNEPYGTRADSCSIAPEPSRAICSALFALAGC